MGLSTISRPIRCLILTGALWTALLLFARADVQVQFSQSSDPPALISSSLVLVPTGTVVSTMTAPMTTGSYRFAHWMFRGVRQQDPLGRGINPVTFVIVEPVDAVARYFLATEDADGDGIPDWFEWHFYGTLANGPLSDTDNDGFTLQQEFQRDDHPNLINTIVDGGYSQRASAMLLHIQDTNVVLFQMVSLPPGVVGTNLPVAVGSQLTLPDVYGVFFGYRFAQWEVNGVRMADALGRSVGQLDVLIASNTTATAVFLSPTASSLGDGVPDWFKLQYYGSTSVSATNDSDGDGLALLDEYVRDTHPNLVDAISDGGLSRRPAERIGFRNPGYVWLTEESSPPGLVANQFILTTNTLYALPDVSTNGYRVGYAFAEWKVNGVRLADVLGRSVPGITIVIQTDTVATAVFFPLDQQTMSDGVPDWFKMQFYGQTNIAANTDTDGDGFTLLSEFQRDTPPHVVDFIADGGLSQRASALLYVYVPYFYKITSHPSNLLNTITDYVPYGTRITTTNAPLSVDGYRFGHWEVGGIRQQDPSGYALNPVSFNVYSNMTVTAHYHLAATDSDADGLPDWWEDYWFGGVTNAAAWADPDADGLSNLEEYQGNSGPLQPDRCVLSAYWLGGTGVWNNAAQWSGGLVPNDTPPTNWVVRIDNGHNASSVVTQNIAVTLERLLLDSGDQLYLLPGVVLTLHRRPTGGVITNAGRIALNGSELRIDGGAGTLTGGGSILLSETNSNLITTTDTNAWFYNFDNTIAGSGQIGNNRLGIINHGTILANPNVPLILDPADHLGFANTGTIQVNAGSTLILEGAGFVQTAGQMWIHGTLMAADGLNIAGGILAGDGTNIGRVSNNGTLAPGQSTGQLTIVGDLVLLSQATLSFEIGGYTPAVQYDLITVTGTTTFNGSLMISLTNQFVQTVTNNARFTVLKTSAMQGGFQNVADGGSLTTADGLARFRVEFIGGTNLVLTCLGTVDTDADGLPDWWEELQGFNKADPTDAAADADGDGMSNLQEYLAGTHPWSAASRLGITNFWRSAGGWEFMFSSVSGKVYRIEWTSDLTASNGWNILLDRTNATSSAIHIVDPSATNVLQRFYRVRLQP